MQQQPQKILVQIPKEIMNRKSFRGSGVLRVRDKERIIPALHHRLQAIPSQHPHISSKLDERLVEVGLCWLTHKTTMTCLPVWLITNKPTMTRTSSSGK